MKRLQATIKAPAAEVDRILAQLERSGVKTVEKKNVPHRVFAEESRLNYDCVFPQLWEEGLDAVYLTFDFEATAEGRAAAFRVEYDLMQIPLNLCYEF